MKDCETCAAICEMPLEPDLSYQCDNCGADIGAQLLKRTTLACAMFNFLAYSLAWAHSELREDLQEELHNLLADAETEFGKPED